MTDLQKQTIRDLYETASEVQKDSLKINFQEAFELQNGIWYTYSDSEGYLVQFTNIAKLEGFGFSPFTGWYGVSKWSIEFLVEATPRQIEDALLKVARAEGLTDGQRIIDVDTFYTIKGELYYCEADDVLHDENHLPIFDGREWPKKAPIATRMSKEVAGDLYNIEIID